MNEEQENINNNINNIYISINKVAEAKGLKSNRSLRLEINKPEIITSCVTLHWAKIPTNLAKIFF